MEGHLPTLTNTTAADLYSDQNSVLQPTIVIVCIFLSSNLSVHILPSKTEGREDLKRLFLSIASYSGSLHKGGASQLSGGLSDINCKDTHHHDRSSPSFMGWKICLTKRMKEDHTYDGARYH